MLNQNLGNVLLEVPYGTRGLKMGARAPIPISRVLFREHYRPDGDGELAEATQSQSLMWAFQSYKSGIYQQFLPSDPTAQTAGTFTLAGNARHEAHIKRGAKRTQSASVWGFLKPLELLA